jgi:hypothetical protein
MPLIPISPTLGVASGGDRALNIVVLSEGFAASRVGVFVSEVRRFDRVLRTTSPFHRFPNVLTVSALFVPSTDSLASITDATRCAWRAPDAAGQIPGDDAPSPFNTPFSALYCRKRDTTPARAFVPRYMRGSTAAVKAAITAEPALSGLAVAALVLIDNNQAFGGGAKEDIGWFSMTGDWVQVAIHELGHSAFGLADEYDNDGPSQHDPAEPRAPNITTRATRDALLAFWSADPSKQTLVRWHQLMDPATPAPTSLPNVTCSVLASPVEAQLAKPFVPPDAVGLFEGADYSPCGVFRPRLACRMRHNNLAFCPVCEWSIGSKLLRVQNPMRVDTRATVPGASTLLAFFHEDPTRAPPGSDLGRLVFYEGGTGNYIIHRRQSLVAPPLPPLSAAGSRIDAAWTSLSTCEIGGAPHLLAHSLPLGRIAIFEVVDAGGAPRLDIRFDSGVNAVPWTHVTTFVRAGVTHMIGYRSTNGNNEISRIDANNAKPTPVASTALDPNNLWLPGCSIITTFPINSVPHVLKHRPMDGMVHIQSLDPPGTGPNTFISQPRHWSPGATVAVGYETNGRTFVHRMSTGNYESLDWVWPGGAGVEMQIHRQSLDITLSAAVIRDKTASGFPPFGAHMVVALDVVGGGVRMMSVG